jgi:Fe-S cluster assembly protein SufB
MDDRIEAYRAWEQMVEPEWANVNYAKPDFQAISSITQHQSS